MCASICALSLFPTAAAARPAGSAYALSGTYGAPGFDPGQFTVPSALEVESSSGNVVTADGGRIQVFAPGPSPGPPVATFSSGADVGLAIDQADGDLYAGDTQSNRIVRFARGGTDAAPTYTLDPSFVSPVAGSGNGELASFGGALAVDPVTRDLLVADPGANRVSRYTRAGTFVRAFDGAGSDGGAFVAPASVAAAPDGSIYVVDITSDTRFGGTSRVEHFTSVGGALGALPGLTTPQRVAVDAADESVVVASSAGVSDPVTISRFTGLTRVASSSFAGQLSGSQLAGLGISPAMGHRVYTLTDSYFGLAGSVGVEVFDRAVLPGVELGPTTAITRTSAHVAGTVDPGGEATQAHFEYAPAGGTFTPTPDQDVGSGTGEVPVSADLAELAPNQTYTLRLVASNGVVSATDEGSFSTAASAPAATTGAATGVSGAAATLNGTVNPFGQQATYHFEYGLTDAYGSRAPAGAEAVAGNGRSPRAVSKGIVGLTPGAVYHYRLVATNPTGTGAGEDRTFVAGGSGVPSRAYEQVSPVSKPGGSAAGAYGTHVSPGGDRLIYASRGSLGSDQDVSSPATPFYASERGSLWDFHPLSPPQLPKSSGVDPTLLSTIVTPSLDNSKVAVVTNKALTPDGEDNRGNVYIRDVQSGAYTLAFTGPKAFYDTQSGAGGRFRVFGASDDLSTLLLTSPTPLTPDQPDDGSSQLYRWRAGQGLTRLGELPDGTHPGTQDRGVPPAEQRLASADGEVTAFSSNFGFAYVERGTQRATDLAVSNVAGQPTDPQPSAAQWVSASGRYVFFSVASDVPLRDGAPAQPGNVYRLDLQANSLQYVGSSPGTAPAFTADGQTAWLVGAAGEIVRWHDGVRTPVGDAVPGGITAFQSSPTGRYLAVTTTERVGTYDNVEPAVCSRTYPLTNGCNEVYRYDADSGQSLCVSCPADGARPSGHAFTYRLNGDRYFADYLPRTVTDEGTVFFDTPQALAPGDTNGTRDVYAFEGGQPVLVSRGSSQTTATIADASADGSNVYFSTDDPLVGQDRDTDFDIYDARVGGGLPAQSPSVAPAPCRRDGCGSPASSTAVTAPSPSPTQATPRSAKRTSIRIIRAAFGRRGGTVVASVSAPGKVGLSGSQIRAVTKRVRRAGRVTLTFKLTRAAVRSLARRKNGVVTVRVTLRPGAGFARSTTLVSRRVSR